MSHDLHEHLDGYSATAAREITVDPHDAWRSGRRRRRTRRVAVTGAAAGLAIAVVFIAVGTPGKVTTDPAANHQGVDQHPVRVADSWSTGQLESDSGPLAGFLMTDGFERFAITDDGGVLEIAAGEFMRDSFPPAISADGTKLGFLRDGSTYVLHDLARGTVVELDDLGDNGSESIVPYTTGSQSPSFWSPTGEHLLITGWRTEDSRGFKLLLGLDGTITEVDAPRLPSANGRAGQAAGWADDEHVGWLQEVGRDGSRGIDYVVADLDGEQLSRTPLEISSRGLSVSQWSGNLSGDGTRLLLLDDADEGWLVDTETGRLVAGGNGGTTHSCPASWRDAEPLVPADLPNPEGGSELRTLDGERITVVDPAFGVSCIVLASDALTGPSAGGLAPMLFGTDDSWLSWHYQEMAVGVLALLALALAGAGVVRRRRAATPPG